MRKRKIIKSPVLRGFQANPVFGINILSQLQEISHGNSLLKRLGFMTVQLADLVVVYNQEGLDHFLGPTKLKIFKEFFKKQSRERLNLFPFRISSFRNTIKFGYRSISIKYYFYPSKQRGINDRNYYSVDVRREHMDDNSDVIVVNCFVHKDYSKTKSKEILKKIYLRCKGYITEWLLETILISQVKEGKIKSYSHGDMPDKGMYDDFYVTLNNDKIIPIELKSSYIGVNSKSKILSALYQVDTTTYLVLDIASPIYGDHAFMSLNKLIENLDKYLLTRVYKTHKDNSKQVFDFLGWFTKK